MTTLQQANPSFRVGDWVALAYGPRRAYARIIEDRGLLGAHGRRLYRIRLIQAVDDPNPLDFEMPEGELELGATKSATTGFLINCGLITLLRANQTGGKDQPRGWLRFDGHGGVEATFTASRGMIGGAPIPFYCLKDGKVFEYRRKEVAEFLASFGLDRGEAEQIIQAVGTAR